MVCLVFMLICATNYIFAEEIPPSDPKIIVDYNPNVFTTRRPNRVTPTSYVVSHKPGVPPGWDKIPARPVILGGLFSFRNNDNSTQSEQKSPRESNIIEVYAEYPSSSNDDENEVPDSRVVTELTVTSDLMNVTSDNHTEFNRTSPSAEAQAIVLESLDTDKTTGVLNWVLTALGISQPAPVPPPNPPPAPVAPPYVPPSVPVSPSAPVSPPFQQPGQGQGQSPIPAPAKNCKPCICGETFKQTRIVGGVETEVNAYPWVVYLKYKDNFYCGGTLISDMYVLTAGHCVSFAKERVTVTLLDHDRASTSDTKTITRRVTNIYRHKFYNNGVSYNNDIALLRLDAPLDLNSLVRPVCLPPIGKTFTGDVGVAVGWGAIKEGGQVSNVLREVAVPILSNEECKMTKYGNKITNNMMCAGDVKNGGIDSCQGDSGGPLHVVKEGKNLVVGVVSWGEGCAQKNYPGVYTRVNRYISWIKANTKDSCFCESTK